MADVQVEAGMFAKSLKQGCAEVVSCMSPVEAVELYGQVGAELLDVAFGLQQMGLTPEEILTRFESERTSLLTLAAVSEAETSVALRLGNGSNYNRAQLRDRLREKAWPYFWDQAGHPDDMAGVDD